MRLNYDRFNYEISDEDDEDGRYNLDEIYASKVGMTGRFNQKDELNPALINDTKVLAESLTKKIDSDFLSCNKSENNNSCNDSSFSHCPRYFYYNN